MNAATAAGQRGAAGLFGGLAGLLRTRPLHPAGVAFDAVLRVREATEPAAALFARAGEHEAVIRFSRGFGLPEPLPEVLSVAIKVRGAYGPGADQDFLLTASGERPGLRHAVVVGRSHLAHGFSTVIPFSVAGRSVVFGLLPHAAPTPGERDLPELARRAAEGTLAFDLRVAALRGPWLTLGRIDVGRRLRADEERCLTFNSDTTGGGIVAAGWVNRLRGAAYDAAGRARPTDPA